MRRIFVLYLTFTVINASLNKNEDKILHQNQETCSKLTMKPYFEPEMVTGIEWRIIYSWKLKLDEKCIDITFKNISQDTVKRIFNDMYDYLEMQPYWDAATLLMSLGHSHHEMLLFVDQGSAGRFVGVPNVIRDGNIAPARKSVPLFQLNMKLFHHGKYLVMSDCVMGVTTLSIRIDTLPTKKQLDAILAELNLGEGMIACISEEAMKNFP
ncbi:uncharacterized protein LOC142981763 [Anticarsia gemmatalis]|uniref:uncharacterized protein LOC142981763 n=1 Tax=Anticarsia gemmatalis TaxID=129554 RepID=UPI003F776BE7